MAGIDDCVKGHAWAQWVDQLLVQLIVNDCPGVPVVKGQQCLIHSIQLVA